MADINQEARIPVYINDEQAKSALKNLTAEAEKWRKKMYEAMTGGDMKGLKEAEKELKKVNGQMNSIKKEAFDVNKVLNNLSTASTKDLGRALTAINKEMSGLNRQSKEYIALAKQKAKIKDEYAKINGELTKQTGLLGKINGLAGGLLPALGIGAIIGGLRSFGSAVIRVRSEFEKYEAVLSNTLGSKSKARQELEMLQEFAKKTPFALSELTGAYVKLTNFGLKPTLEDLKRYGDLAASAGKGFDQLTEAIADAVTGEFERLKEFNIRAKKDGDKVTFTFKEQATAVDFNATAIRKYIASLGELEGVAGTTEAAVKTMGGQINNLGDAWDQLLNTIGERTGGVIYNTVSVITEGIDTIARKMQLLESKDLTWWQKLAGVFGNTESTFAISEIGKSIGQSKNNTQTEPTVLGEVTVKGNKNFKQDREKAQEKKNAAFKKLSETNNKEDDEDPIKMPNWFEAQSRAEAERLAEKKATEKEWTDFLKKQVDDRIYILDQELKKDQDNLEIEKELTEARKQLKSEYIGAISQVAGALSSMFKEGSAAQIAFLAIEKGAAIAQIIFQTAIANAKAVAVSPLTAGQPWVSINTISAAASIAGIVATTITSFKDKKGNDKAGYYDGGYTPAGGKYQPTGIVHAGEYVIPQEGVRNPALRPIIDLFEMARRSGSLARLNFGAGQFASGGFTPSTSYNSPPVGGVAAGRGGEISNEEAKALTVAINKLMEWKPKVYSEKIKKDIDELNEIDSRRGLR